MKKLNKTCGVGKDIRYNTFPIPFRILVNVITKQILEKTQKSRYP